MKKLLIVVDYQNDFVSGSLGYAGAEKLEGPIAEKIKAYHALGDKGQVIFTMDTHDRHYLETQEGRHLPVEHCLEEKTAAALRQHQRAQGAARSGLFQADLRFLRAVRIPAQACGRL